MSLHFEPVWNWLLTIVAIAAMVFVLLFGYPRRIRHLPVQWRRILFTLRLASLLLLALLLLRPVLVLERNDDANLVLYLLADESRSTQTRDMPGGISRRDAILKLIADAQPLLQRLEENGTEIRLRDFAEQLTPAPVPAPTAEGRMTAQGAVLNALSEEAGNSRVVTLMLGDGRQAAGGSLDADPLQAARIMGRRQQPVYTVPFGGAESIEEGLDLALDELDVTTDVFGGNVLPVRVRLKTKGARGETLNVRLFAEDRSRVGPGTSGPMVPVEFAAQTLPIVQYTPQSATEETVLELRMIPDQIGEIKIAVEATPLPTELRRTNNRVEAIIRVRHGGIRVAYLDRLRPEVKWLRPINRSRIIQLDYFTVWSGRFASRTNIPDDIFRPGRYDAYILGDIPASSLTATQQRQLLECCRGGAGLMMIGGLSNFGNGGYQDSPLAPLIPVDLADSSEQLQDRQKVLPTVAGLGHYLMRIAPPEQNRALWEELPELPGVSLLRRRAGSLAQVWRAWRPPVPLLIGQDLGGTRVVAFAGDETWRWFMQGHPEQQQRFWRQVIFWLTHKDLDLEQAVWVSAQPPDVSPGNPTELSFGARDSEGNPLDDVEFALEVTGPDGQKHDLRPRPSGSFSVADFTETMESGDYWAHVHATKDGVPLQPIPDAMARFTVNSRDPELDYPAADPDLLREVAHLSGGSFLTAEEFLLRLEDWAEHGLPGAQMKRTQRRTLWDNWFVVLAFVIFVAAEWTLRRKRGLA
ncbi:MAG: hypothetical protein KDA85_05125 [Planctomycetaceae bacterium]|nr:hypothetical protein [Planctomycetaceae bacterium]